MEPIVFNNDKEFTELLAKGDDRSDFLTTCGGREVKAGDMVAYNCVSCGWSPAEVVKVDPFTIKHHGEVMSAIPLDVRLIVPFYFQKFLSAANTVLDTILDLDWLSVVEARREYFMSDKPRSYIYGKGKGEREYHSAPFSHGVDTIMNHLNSDFKTAYNVCFLNRYDTARDQLGWHADDSPTMDRDHPIAVISVGAEREIWWRKNGETGVVPKENRQLLHHGSLFIMPRWFQDYFQHRIPKADRQVGTRISMTFRRYV